MGQTVRLTTPLLTEDVTALRAGDLVSICGIIYTARDAAHKRLHDLIVQGKELPVDLRGQLLYYVGPAPAKPGHVVGSAGPTTSGRMDVYTPELLKLGLKGTIGKGLRSPAVVQAMREHGAVYLGVVGGAAALLARSVKAARVVAYEDLGPEAIHEFVVEDFPAIVVIDSRGENLYEREPARYASTLAGRRE